MAGKTVWGYSTSDNPDRWVGMYNTREDAIHEGREACGREPFWVCEGRPVALSEVLPGASETEERIAELAYELVGEAAEGWAEFSDEAKVEYDALLASWVQCHIGKPEFWSAEGFVPECING